MAGFCVGCGEPSGCATRNLVEVISPSSTGKERNNNDHEAVSKYRYGLREKGKNSPSSHAPSAFTELLFQIAENKVLAIINH